MSRVARADDRDAQRIGRFDRTLDESERRRVGDFGQRARVGWIIASDDLDAIRLAIGDFSFGVDLFGRGGDLFAQLRPNARHVAEMARGSGEHGLRRAEPRDERFPGSRADARDERQSHRGNKFVAWRRSRRLSTPAERYREPSWNLLAITVEP